MLLIRSLTSSYDILTNTLIYERESISLEEVQAALMSKELSKKADHKDSDQGENLMAEGRSEKKITGQV